MKLPMTAILCLAPSLARAQPLRELDIAFKGGPNAATQAEDLRVNRYGVSGGLSGDLKWSLIDHFWLAGQLDLLYTPRGAEVVFQGEHVGKSREHYIDLMVAARPEAHLGWASVYLLLGGGVNFLVSASKEDASGASQDITGDLHRVDVALLGGAGIALYLPNRELGPLRFSRLFLEARHDIGLLDVDLTGGFKNRTSSLMLGLSFVVGGAPPTEAATGSVK
jgi:hypothetical protein